MPMMLPAPAFSGLDWRDGQSMTLAEPPDHTRRLAGRVPLPRQAPWPRQWPLTRDGAAIALPVPAQEHFPNTGKAACARARSCIASRGNGADRA